MLPRLRSVVKLCIGLIKEIYFIPSSSSSCTLSKSQNKIAPLAKAAAVSWGKGCVLCCGELSFAPRSHWEDAQMRFYTVQMDSRTTKISFIKRSEILLIETMNYRQISNKTNIYTENLYFFLLRLVTISSVMFLSKWFIILWNNNWKCYWCFFLKNSLQIFKFVFFWARHILVLWPSNLNKHLKCF